MLGNTKQQRTKMSDNTAGRGGLSVQARAGPWFSALFMAALSQNTCASKTV